MKISYNFKNKCKEALELGYKYVYSHGGSYGETTYITKWKIDDLLNKDIGDSVRAFRANSNCRWSGCATTKDITNQDISYMHLMTLNKG